MRKIGQGGFGTVWLARNRHDGHFYAVKTIQSGSEVEVDGVREYKKRADCSNYLMPIGHVGYVNNIYYYVMPLADNAIGSTSVNEWENYEPLTLQREIDCRGQLSVFEVVRFALDVLMALDHLHTTGARHRDVKPTNIVSLEGVWRLCDAD